MPRVVEVMAAEAGGDMMGEGKGVVFLEIEDVT